MSLAGSVKSALFTVGEAMVLRQNAGPLGNNGKASSTATTDTPVVVSFSKIEPGDMVGELVQMQDRLAKIAADGLEVRPRKGDVLLDDADNPTRTFAVLGVGEKRIGGVTVAYNAHVRGGA